MIVGRVRGNVVCSVAVEGLAGRTLLVVEKLDAAGEPTGSSLIAVDSVGAGVGELVLLLDEGNGARQILGRAGLPVRTVVVGTVDDVLR